jgi:hypothetical protein
VSRSLQSAPAHDLPLAVEDVTAGWLTSALSLRFPGVQVTSARHEAILQGTATKIRVRALYGSKFAFADAPEAYRHLAVASHFGEVVITHDRL